jgi:hypothetical protein
MKTNRRNAILVVFTRYPVAGQVKTRLIKALGPQGAADMHRRMTVFTVDQAKKTGVSVQIRYTGGSVDQMRAWLGPDHDYVDQGEGDLGQRLERAFDECFDQGARFVMVMGTDCPDNRASTMVNGLRLLDTHPCVIGPAADGGYYMIGLSRPQPRLFRHIPWGTGGVLNRTLAAADSFILLETLSDVDEPEDLPPRISVIVPTLNESRNMDSCLQNVNEGFDVECLVVDGGSTDDTRIVALKNGARVCVATPGRARQMNQGAREASGDIFLFLHADCLLPDGWDIHLRRVMKDPRTAIGCFSLRIRESFPSRPWVEWGINLRTRILKRPYGDQGLFVRRKTFFDLGGYLERPILEDVCFVTQAKAFGRLDIVLSPLATSGRRWERFGFLKTLFLNQLILLGSRLDVDSQVLKTLYEQGRWRWSFLLMRKKR